MEQDVKDLIRIANNIAFNANALLMYREGTDRYNNAERRIGELQEELETTIRSIEKGA